jgi:hypothetical protein
MRQVEWSKLPLWEVLQTAAIEPEDANVARLWQEVEEAIVDFDYPEQLQVAGEAISQIADVFRARSVLTFEELQATASHDGPIMPQDAFDRYVRQTMQIDFEEYIEPLVGLPRKVPQMIEVDRSIIVEVGKQELLTMLEESESVNPETTYEQAIAIAHEENISEWGATISAWLNYRGQPVSLLELHRSLKMPLVRVWLALLLNGFEIEQRGEFYDTENVWIVPKA